MHTAAGDYREALVDTYSESRRFDEAEDHRDLVARAEDDVCARRCADIAHFGRHPETWTSMSLAFGNGSERPQDDYLRGLLSAATGAPPHRWAFRKQRFDEAVLLSLRWLEEGLHPNARTASTGCVIYGWSDVSDRAPGGRAARRSH
jgi:hypothetical protein